MYLYNKYKSVWIKLPIAEWVVTGSHWCPAMSSHCLAQQVRREEIEKEAGARSCTLLLDTFGPLFSARAGNRHSHSTHLNATACSCQCTVFFVHVNLGGVAGLGFQYQIKRHVSPEEGAKTEGQQATYSCNLNALEASIASRDVPSGNAPSYISSWLFRCLFIMATSKNIYSPKEITMLQITIDTIRWFQWGSQYGPNLKFWFWATPFVGNPYDTMMPLWNQPPPT